MNKVFASFQIKAVQEDERIIEGIASTGRPDRMSDVVEPRGIVYALPVPFLLDHDHKAAVGEVESLDVSDTEIRFRARIAKIAEDGPAKTLTDNAWSLIKAGLRKSVSIGFRPLDRERINGGGYRFKSWELLELSAVSVPAQPDARVTATRAAADKHPGSVYLDNHKGHIVRLQRPPVHVAKRNLSRIDDYRAYCRQHRRLFAQALERGEQPPALNSYDQWIFCEDMLDKRIPGRAAKRQARARR